MNSISQFRQIQIRELPTWVKVMKNSPDIKTTEDMLNELTLIDDLLTLQASKALLNRKKGLGQLLEARIGKELGYTTPNLNRK